MTGAASGCGPDRPGEPENGGPSRRRVLQLSAAALGASAFGGWGLSGLGGIDAARAADGAMPAIGPRHGLSVFGELKHGADFSAFTYVNPDAPKGGKLMFRPGGWSYNQNPQTFNTLNTLTLKGDAPPLMEICFDSLMVRAYDEPDAVYGLIARSVEVSEDGNTYTFNLRPEARFHDKSPITAEDVAFSMMLLKEKGHPQLRQVLASLDKAVALNPGRVELVFSGTQGRQTPLLVSVLPVVSKAYYTTYDFEQSSLTPPLVSGPYKVGDRAVGRYIEYDRVKDYWAKDLPVMAGQNNFDTIRVEFFRDHQVAFEAFKKGDITFHEEFYSKLWATGYDFPALNEGKVVRKTFPDDRPAGAQGWFLNTRRDKFADPRVREAIGLAFDFEWSNKSLFYGLYERTRSFFENSDMMATGLPSEAELALLEPFRAELPEAVFAEAWMPPVSDGSGTDRKLLARALKLLGEAGYRKDGTRLVNGKGEQLSFEFLSNSPSFERIVLPYIQNLERLGIAATFRVVDPAQYQSRVNDFDFDIVSSRFALTATPGEDVKQLWSSEAARTPGTRNLAGIDSPAVDALIAGMTGAASREELLTATRALDRVLRLGHYWVPQWTKSIHTVAIWDMFGYPETLPAYDVFPVATTWWIEPDKAKALGKAG
ncbi:extracellular solute-binding protein [Roseibium aestuarii]|uniref:Extracellular solute-binding protein n=1 Tax=Roseibium aestuarii TaxID=2600299 RepID=A0ABW4JZB2_9HYPH|nr:extracellular solute-binding protein [Roseibium aestuarii]